MTAAWRGTRVFICSHQRVGLQHRNGLFRGQRGQRAGLPWQRSADGGQAVGWDLVSLSGAAIEGAQ